MPEREKSPLDAEAQSQTQPQQRESDSEAIGTMRDHLLGLFIDRHPDAEFVSFNLDGQVMVMIQEKGLQCSDYELVAELLSKQAKVASDGIADNCFTIARLAVEDGTFDGAVYALRDAQRFTFYNNHASNFKRLKDGSILGVDLTAPHNFDSGRGVYQVFCFHTSSIPKLKEYLSGLHGSTWIAEEPSGHVEE